MAFVAWQMTALPFIARCTFDPPKLAKAVWEDKSKPCQTDEKIEDIFHQFGGIAPIVAIGLTPRIIPKNGIITTA